MKLLIAGSRDDYSRAAQIEELLKKLKPDEVVAGACRGVDTTAAQVARRMGIKVTEFPADWSKGKSAGPQRNEQMLEYVKEDKIIAIFHSNLAESKGTAHILARARYYGFRIIVNMVLES